MVHWNKIKVELFVYLQQLKIKEGELFLKEKCLKSCTYKYMCSSNEPTAWCVADEKYCLYRRQNEAFIYTLDIFYALGHRRSF